MQLSLTWPPARPPTSPLVRGTNRRSRFERGQLSPENWYTPARLMGRAGHFKIASIELFAVLF